MVAQVSRIKRGSFYVAMVLISLLVVEAGFRAVLAFQVGPSVLYYGTRFQRQNVPAATNNHTVMQHENTQQGYTKFFPHELKIDHDPATNETFRVSINSQGFRGGEIEETKKPGVIRIVTLGSSSTFGYYDRDHETYPYYLEQKLNKNSEGTGRFEVINLGIPHLRSEEILALFYAEAIPLHPDVVTFYEGANDAARGNSSVNEGDRKNSAQRQKQSVIAPLKAVYGMVRDHLVTVAFIDSIRQNMIAEPTFNRGQVERHMASTSEHFLGNIDELYQECQRRGIIFVALKQQAKSHIVKEADMKGVTYAQEVQMIKDKLEKEGAIKTRELHLLTHNILTTDLEHWAAFNHVPFVNIQKVLDQDRDVLMSWVHLSPRGNRMIADALAEKIRQLVGHHTVRQPESRTQLSFGS
ncbi:MAG TPA: SGNH/GDSL hydrolase family protein [Nitrospira sp.]|nr:SGNH/GDSL hydrolase family protein [Nitrospira sp.]